MKTALIVFLMTSLFTNFAFAEEVATECPYMKEANERNNPKANIVASKPKPKSSSTASAQ